MQRLSHPLGQSILIHLGLGFIFLTFSFGLNRFYGSAPRKIKIQIQEIAPQVNPPEKVEINIQSAPKPSPKMATKRIFGVSEETLKSDKAGSVEVKAGNTIAKDIDQEKFTDNDKGSLPIPTEEYLVQQMPKLKSEIRIPYPPQAKAKNIEGVVMMEVLIDEEGKVRQAKLIDGPGFGLNEAAMDVIYKFEFTPAMMDRKPVAVRIRYGYRFVLN